MLAALQPVADAALYVGAATVILAGVWRVYRIVRRIDATLGVDKYGRTIAERLERVEYQLFPNGGSSLADRVGRIAMTQAEQGAELRVVHEIVTGSRDRH